MIDRGLARRSCSAPQADSVAAAADVVLSDRRYSIAIDGVHQRPTSRGVAEALFHRWSQRPDVLMHGDLQDGFYWEWPDARGTRIEIHPERSQTIIDVPASGA